MDEPERGRPPTDVFVIEWYRPSSWGRLIGAWALATSTLGVGVLGIALALDGSGRVPPTWRWVAGAVGAVATVFGATGGIFGIIRMMARDDAYLLVRSDGIVVSDGRDGGAVLTWRSLGDIALEGDALVLSRDGGEPVRVKARFSGIAPEALVKRLQQLRRDALLGVLRRPRR